MRQPLAVLTVVLLCCAFLVVYAHGDESSKPAASEPDARKQLIGIWRGYAVEGKGETPDRGPAKLQLTITEKSIHGIEIKAGERVDHGEGAFTLDLAADPKVLDASQTGERGRARAYLGIYKLEGDTLKWCVSPQKKRPATFETGKGQFLMILKRDPKSR